MVHVKKYFLPTYLLTYILMLHNIWPIKKFTYCMIKVFISKVRTTIWFNFFDWFLVCHRMSCQYDRRHKSQANILHFSNVPSFLFFILDKSQQKRKIFDNITQPCTRASFTSADVYE